MRGKLCLNLEKRALVEDKPKDLPFGLGLYLAKKFHYQENQ